MIESIYPSIINDDFETIINYSKEFKSNSFIDENHLYNLYTILIDYNAYNCIQILLDNNILFNYSEKDKYPYKFCEQLFDQALKKGDSKIIQMIDSKRKQLNYTEIDTKTIKKEALKIVDTQHLNPKGKKLQKLEELNLAENIYDIIKEKIHNSNKFDRNEDWINSFFKIPFGKYSYLPVNSKNSLTDIQKFVAQSKIKLDKISYGMDNVKEEIIDIVCQLIRSPNSNIKVIGLCGSPGIGKTNFIKNGLSKILQRPFQHICMGGITDSAYLIGHEMSYNNSRYGIIVNSLMNSNVMNPIIFMDELDKVSKTEKGIDVENVLIHLTDPVQNMSFMDKYFQGIEIDVSKVMFIFSFNDENKISPILRDRMHIVYVKDPTENDKIEIAKQFLIPSLLQNINIDNVKEIDKKVIRKIITEYCKEEKGVRELKRCLEKILLKINTSLYSEKSKYKSLETIDINNIKLTEKMVEEILERPDKFESHNSMYI